MAQQARQVLTACEAAPADAVPVNYDPRNPFDIDCLTFTPIYRGSKYVEDKYTGEAVCVWWWGGGGWS
jgi:coatomer protein complex subunit alpha (xenin)